MLFLNLARINKRTASTRFIEDFLSADDILATVKAAPPQKGWARRELMVSLGHKDWALVKTGQGFAAVSKPALSWASKRRDEEQRMRSANMW